MDWFEGAAMSDFLPFLAQPLDEWFAQFLSDEPDPDICRLNGMSQVQVCQNQFNELYTFTFDNLEFCQSLILGIDKIM